MFDLSGGAEGGFDTFRSVLEACFPSAKISTERPAERFAWNGQFFVHRGCSLWQAQSSRGWSTRFTEGVPGMGVAFPLVGNLEVGDESDPVFYRPGTAFLAGNVDELNLRRSHWGGPYAYVVLGWDQDAVATTLTSLYPNAIFSKQNVLSTIDLRSAQGFAFDTAAKSLTRVMRIKGDMPVLALELLSEAVLRIIIDIGFPALKEASECKPEKVRPRHINMALEFIHANLAAPIRIRDVAKICGVSVRALEVGFNSHLCASPAGYLRKARLEAARKELLDRNGDEANICEIAYKWGFSSVSRFSKAYRGIFGEKPSDTRRCGMAANKVSHSRLMKTGKSGKRVRCSGGGEYPADIEK